MVSHRWNFHPHLSFVSRAASRDHGRKQRNLSSVSERREKVAAMDESEEQYRRWVVRPMKMAKSRGSNKFPWLEFGGRGVSLDRYEEALHHPFEESWQSSATLSYRYVTFHHRWIDPPQTFIASYLCLIVTPSVFEAYALAARILRRAENFPRLAELASLCLLASCGNRSTGSTGISYLRVIYISNSNNASLVSCLSFGFVYRLWFLYFYPRFCPCERNEKGFVFHESKETFYNGNSSIKFSKRSQSRILRVRFLYFDPFRLWITLFLWKRNLFSWKIYNGNSSIRNLIGLRSNSPKLSNENSTCLIFIFRPLFNSKLFWS